MSEIHQWSILWMGKKYVPNNLVEMAAKCDTYYFSKIKHFLQICATFPGIFCECEEHLCSPLSENVSAIREDRLSSLALIYVHRDKYESKSRTLREKSLIASLDNYFFPTFYRILKPKEATFVTKPINFIKTIKPFL